MSDMIIVGDVVVHHKRYVYRVRDVSSTLLSVVFLGVFEDSGDFVPLAGNEESICLNDFGFEKASKEQLILIGDNPLVVDLTRARARAVTAWDLTSDEHTKREAFLCGWDACVSKVSEVTTNYSMHDLAKRYVLARSADKRSDSEVVAAVASHVMADECYKSKPAFGYHAEEYQEGKWRAGLATQPHRMWEHNIPSYESAVAQTWILAIKDGRQMR